MSSSNSAKHNPTPSVASTETPITEHDDGSVIASDDVDVTSTSTPSITEQDPPTPLEDPKLSPSSPPPQQQLQQQPPGSPSTPVKSPSGAVLGSAGTTVQLLRRKPDSKQQSINSSPTTPTTTANNNVRVPSPITRLEGGSTTGQNPVMIRETVDPSLLEAYAHPINRQYLLQLEASLNNFVSQARTDTLELPPTNSFFRCLAHKMAELYKLQHVAESGHVILFRSQFARIPDVKLSELSKSTFRPVGGSPSSSIVASEDGNTPAPTSTSTPEFKQIMKRVPTAKSTKLEGVDDDAKSEGSTSQILTHEERQAVYEKTRARIFSDYVESQKGSSDVGEKASGTSAVGGGGSSDEAGSETSSTRREKSLHRSDSFQTRQQFARESGMTYSSYAAALTGQQQQQHQAPQTQTQLPTPVMPTTATTTAYPGYPTLPTNQPGYIPYNPYQQPPQQYPYSPYPPPPTMIPYPPAATSSTPRDTPSSHGPSRPESRTSSPASHRNDAPNFHPNPFAREFIPVGSSSSSVSHPPRLRNSAPTTPPHSQRNSATPPIAQQVKKTASFEGNAPSSAPGSSRPISPTPVYARSQSATSMRPTNPGVGDPPVSGYVGFLPGGQALPFPPPKLSTPRQIEYGTPITVGTVRYIANGQPIAPQVLHYRAHPLPPMPVRLTFPVPAPATGQTVNEEGGGRAPEMELNENHTSLEVEDGGSAEQRGELEEVIVEQ